MPVVAGGGGRGRYWLRGFQHMEHPAAGRARPRDLGSQDPYLAAPELVSPGVGSAHLLRNRFRLIRIAIELTRANDPVLTRQVPKF